MVRNEGWNLKPKWPVRCRPTCRVDTHVARVSCADHVTESGIRHPCDVGIVIRPELWLLGNYGRESVVRASRIWSGKVALIGTE